MPYWSSPNRRKTDPSYSISGTKNRRVPSKDSRSGCGVQVDPSEPASVMSGTAPVVPGARNAVAELACW